VNTHMGALRTRFFSTISAQSPPVFFVEQEHREQNSLLGPTRRFPLPGNVCSSTQWNENPEMVNSSQPKTSANRNTVLTSLETILAKDQTFVDQNQLHRQMESASAEIIEDVPVEIKAQKCPRLLRKDMKSLFPHMELSQANVNIINLSQRSSTDQSAWTAEMEAERDKLTANFVNTATTICSALEKMGYWADFIDPSSGRPYLGQFTNATLFETDEAFQQLGFQIEDLGCCKVLKHIKWGSHAFVGTIFTDAPMGSQIMKQLLDEKTESDGSNS